MRSRRPENEDPSSATEEEDNSDDASGETPVPKSKPENGSDSDSDLGSPSEYKLQPISRKRTNQETQSPAVKSAAKKSKTAAGSSTPGGSSTRLWSDEDEVALLKGIIEYNKSTGNSFNADLGAFYRFMEGKLGINVKKDQFTAKIRKLKAKFMDALKKGGNGEPPAFSKPHELKMFKISKKIWGGSVDDVKVGEKGENSKKQRRAVEVELDEKEKDGGGSVKKVETQVGEVVLDEKKKKKKDNGKRVKKGESSKKQPAVEPVEVDEKEKDEGEEEEEEAKEEMEEEVDFQSKYPFLSHSYSNLMSSVPSVVLSESGMSSALKRIRSIGDGKAKELDDKWKQLIMQEAELSYKKLALMKEQMGMAADH